ncbi:MAG: citrate lyase beta subunit [Sediminicola sp.]|jgi:citrate lyase beta subunit|tara:strand:+ start:1469 stop:2296 length:828 start_codon:yes stop_codon:yes gene_type:complete
MKSYFFVPASKLNKLPDITKKGIDKIIIDFEDAILSIDREGYLKEFIKIENFEDFWIRVPVREEFTDEINITFLTEVYRLGIRNIVLPKIISSKELVDVMLLFLKSNFLILIEHPKLLIEIKNVFLNYPEMAESIKGLGLGSHDLMAFIGSKHDYEQLDYPRKEMLYLAKAYGIEAIDIASMNISDEISFANEIEYAIMNGYDGKFLIHPKQIDWLKNETKISKENLIWAKEIVSKLPKDYKGGSIEPFVLNNEVIEKPHVIKALEILNNVENGE